MISPPTVTVANNPDTSAQTGSSPLSEPGSSRSSPTTPEGLSPSETQASRIKSSARLNHWSRARAKRSGRKLSRPVQQPTDQNCPNSPIEVTVDNNNGVGSELQPPSPRSKGGSEGEHVGDVTAGGKSIYMVSDATGWMAENSVNAALGQFEHCLADRGCAVSTHLFSGINDVDRLRDIIAHAAREGAMLVYTLADPSITEFAKQACEHWGVTSLDILGPVTEAIASHLDVSPSGLPRWASGRKRSLGEEYFQRIEAVEFTIKQDDGALPENLRNADIILAGVSRSGKTPLSIYLAQKGYKVANVPIVMNVELPRTLFEVDPEKVFALTINPVVLHNIRTERAKSLGFSEKIQSSYSDLGHVKQELEFANKIFQQNPIWPVIEVTGRAVEETAAFILKVYHDRTSKFSMPRISRHF